MNDQQAKLSYRRIAIRMPYQFCCWRGWNQILMKISNSRVLINDHVMKGWPFE